MGYIIRVSRKGFDGQPEQLAIHFEANQKALARAELADWQSEVRKGNAFGASMARCNNETIW